MSETNAQAITTDPIPNVPSVDPPAPVPEPAPDPARQHPAPAEQTEEEKRDEEQKQQARQGDKRFAVLSARLSAAQRVQAEQRAELEFWRAQQRQPATPDTPEAREQQLREQIRAEETMKIRAETFHADGGAQFPDWQKKCADLMAMGADPGLASLLVEMPGGVRVAAALADDPEEVQRIAGIRSERGRAIALGAYAAKLGNGKDVGAAIAASQAAPVTRAPAPVRPVSGRASPAFNEYTASAQELVDHYLKPAKR